MDINHLCNANNMYLISNSIALSLFLYNNPIKNYQFLFSWNADDMWKPNTFIRMLTSHHYKLLDIANVCR